ncbi:PXMP2/4 family protein 4 isoform X2 [Procambarus clarkii]|uniref:PXMP2/4 family protein 4 isoform X2 n=1 Tax=Procambarus clarkii TaxID=6728 RepID=UPI001E673E2C|nr:PXMP2/4 family protein 4-like isoform X2 [Procambarus clarkii]
MAKLLKAIKRVGEHYPIVRGMATYSVLWPTSNLVQQSLDKTRDKYDLMESVRYLVFGTFATAPTVYAWVRLASIIVKGNTLKHAIYKAGLEQIVFAPAAQTQFYLGITLLEGRPWAECVQEWKEKLIPTWKVGVCIWPLVQTINFAYVAEKNRVVVVSVASFMWTIFLSYMHHLDQDSLPLFLRSKPTVSNRQSQAAGDAMADIRPHKLWND